MDADEDTIFDHDLFCNYIAKPLALHFGGIEVGQYRHVAADPYVAADTDQLGEDIVDAHVERNEHFSDALELHSPQLVKPREPPPHHPFSEPLPTSREHAPES